MIPYENMDAYLEINSMVKASSFIGVGFSNSGAKNVGSSTKGVRPSVGQHSKVRSPSGNKDVALDPRSGNFQWAYEFYRDIAPAIRMRQLGVKKLPANELEAFNQLNGIPVMLSDSIPEGVAGRHYSADSKGRGEKIVLRKGTRKDGSEYATPGKLVHELRHALEKRVASKKKDTDFLDSIFGYIGTDITPGRLRPTIQTSREEMLTTNKEHQFRVYERLRNNLGRPPTAPEYFKYVDEIPEGDLYLNVRKRPANGYQYWADKFRSGLIRNGMRRYREALKSVSRNGRSTTDVEQMA